MTDPLLQIYSKHFQSQAGRARELKFWEHIHSTLCVTCHLSCVTGILSHVTCHVSPVTCNFFLPWKKLGQSGGASRLRVCYQRGLPRLVLGLLFFCSLGVVVVAAVLGSVCWVSFIKRFGGMDELWIFDVGQLDNTNVSAGDRCLYYAYTFDGLVLFKPGKEGASVVVFKRMVYRQEADRAAGWWSVMACLWSGWRRLSRGPRFWCHSWQSWWP